MKILDYLQIAQNYLQKNKRKTPPYLMLLGGCNQIPIILYGIQLLSNSCNNSTMDDGTHIGRNKLASCYLHIFFYFYTLLFIFVILFIRSDAQKLKEVYKK